MIVEEEFLSLGELENLVKEMKIEKEEGMKKQKQAYLLQQLVSQQRVNQQALSDVLQEYVEGLEALALAPVDFSRVISRLIKYQGEHLQKVSLDGLALDKSEKNILSNMIQSLALKKAFTGNLTEFVDSTVHNIALLESIRLQVCPAPTTQKRPAETAEVRTTNKKKRTPAQNKQINDTQRAKQVASGMPAKISPSHVQRHRKAEIRRALVQGLHPVSIVHGQEATGSSSYTSDNRENEMTTSSVEHVTSDADPTNLEDTGYMNNDHDFDAGFYGGGDDTPSEVDYETGREEGIYEASNGGVTTVGQDGMDGAVNDGVAVPPRVGLLYKDPCTDQLSEPAGVSMSIEQGMMREYLSGKENLCPSENNNSQQSPIETVIEAINFTTSTPAKAAQMEAEKQRRKMEMLKRISIPKVAKQPNIANTNNNSNTTDLQAKPDQQYPADKSVTTSSAATSTQQLPLPILVETKVPIVQTISESEKQQRIQLLQQRRAQTMPTQIGHSKGEEGTCSDDDDDNNSSTESENSSTESNNSDQYNNSDCCYDVDENKYSKVYTLQKAEDCVHALSCMLQQMSAVEQTVIDLTCMPCNTLASKRPSLKRVKPSRTEKPITMAELKVKKRKVLKDGTWLCPWCIPEEGDSSRTGQKKPFSKNTCYDTFYERHLASAHMPQERLSEKYHSCPIESCTYLATTSELAILHFFTHDKDPWFKNLYHQYASFYWKEYDLHLNEDLKALLMNRTRKNKVEERYCIWILSQVLPDIEGFDSFEAGYSMSGKMFKDENVKKSAENAQERYIADAYIVFKIRRGDKIITYLIFFECDEDGHPRIKAHEESIRMEHMSIASFEQYTRIHTSDPPPKIIFVRMNAKVVKEKATVDNLIDERLKLVVQLIYGIVSEKVLVNEFVTVASIGYDLSHNKKNVMKSEEVGWKAEVPKMKEFPGWY